MSIRPKAGAVLFAKDLNRMAKFYEGLASMTIVHSERGVIVLESDDIQLVLHGIPPAIAETIEITTPPVRRENTPIKLFFPVTSIAESRAKAVGLGGELNPKEAEWGVRGFRACDGCDPEGNVLQLRETAP